MNAIETIQARAGAAPSWLRAIVGTGAFLLPAVFVVGAWGPYGWVLGILAGVAGPGKYTSLLAYLLCVLPVLLIGGWVIQTVGARRLGESER